MASSTGTPVDLFLIGKTGNGKSASGNSILGRDVFTTSDCASPETFNVQTAWARRHNRVIKVVDSPGACDTRLSAQEAARKLCDDMAQGIFQCPEGFHALLLVLKYSNRCTDEERGTIEALKVIFGPTFVQDFCIIIFTHGELFDMKNESDPSRTFKDWCHEQTDTLQTLLSECQYRTVLFYNMKPEKNQAQVEQLLTMVDNLASRGRRYTSDLFHRAREERQKFITQRNMPELEGDIQAKIDLLRDGLHRARSYTELSDEVLRIVSDLKQDAQDLKKEITQHGTAGNNSLNSLNFLVDDIIQNLDSHVELMKERRRLTDMKASQEKQQEEFARIRNDLDRTRANLTRLETEFGNQIACPNWGEVIVEFARIVFSSPIVHLVADAILSVFRRGPN